MSEDEIKTLLHQIALRDEDAFRNLYRHYYAKLLQFSFSICKNKQWAEEIAEDVFINLWRNHNTAAQIQHPNVYLYTSIKNGTLNYMAQQARRNITEPFAHLDIELAENPADSLIEKETLQKVAQAIETLPPRCKMVFKLIREDGLKYKEVAEILNISPKTVDTQMTLAIKRLFLFMKDDIQKRPDIKLFFKKN
ncbi:MAG TPA: RNA polymerase sigma-70 factor [Ferruginibacter sp.]|nr:RNA polymerase sigma-70 factor [Bacteroidota bacterium]MCC6691840.1 RNA polymerase sigma-70 factor [Chitinophagaceae bacterium]HMT95929.1 RNA polymerase sigma-70 factor [Ferruginibacter sp.]HMU23452.1 RNA polymerase sigma-70 factor [Ferruginibacter sp.]HRD43614.1 RNA polymerase sigma-70 factor [Ferruginibacter sp.]